jgi:hypothetical protein
MTKDGYVMSGYGSYLGSNQVMEISLQKKHELLQ